MSYVGLMILSAVSPRCISSHYDFDVCSSYPKLYEVALAARYVIIARDGKLLLSGAAKTMSSMSWTNLVIPL